MSGEAWRDMTLGEVADRIEANEEMKEMLTSWLADNPGAVNDVIDWVIGWLIPGEAA